LYTPEYLNSLKFKVDGEFSINLFSSPSGIQDHVDGVDDHWFQILVYDYDEVCKEPSYSKPKLVQAKKEELIKKYKLDPLSLPSSGVIVNQGFVNTNDPSYSTIRFLLQCRKLSQLFTSTWIDIEDIEDIEDSKFKAKLIKIILNTFNIAPKHVDIDDNPIDASDYHNYSDNKNKKKDNYIIKPDSQGYSSIKLPLLFSGQAYYKKNDQYLRVLDPILSTYEAVWEYAIKISWDTFYASRIDISQAGIAPNPPYTQVTMGYPPKPSAFNITDQQIKDWANAKDQYEDYQDEDYENNKSFPFYPQKDTAPDSEWMNKKIQYISPPCPYVPLSCF